LFSVIDALVDTPIAGLLTKLPFSADMRAALTAHYGEKGRLPACVTAGEGGDLDHAQTIIPNADQRYPAVLT
jgi:c-di-GMP-related signal transduction protein